MYSNDTSQTFSRLLEAEHGRLHADLANVRAKLRELASEDAPTEGALRVSAAFRNLRTHLDRHFRQEEAEGCLNEAVARCPRLSHNARLILSEHAELLRETDRLIAQTECLKADPLDRQSLLNAFEELARTLFAHEAAERKLLLEGFGGSSSFDTN
jgi:hypothetical protein